MNEPARMRKALIGGMPNRHLRGQSKGKPSLVMISVARCETTPIIKAHQTGTKSIKIKGDSTSNSSFNPPPVSASPSNECDKCRCPPMAGQMTLATNGPNLKLSQKSLVGWSMSGNRPPIKLAPNATTAVGKVMTGSTMPKYSGANKTNKIRAVVDAKSWVFPVIGPF